MTDEKHRSIQRFTMICAMADTIRQVHQSRGKDHPSECLPCGDPSCKSDSSPPRKCGRRRCQTMTAVLCSATRPHDTTQARHLSNHTELSTPHQYQKTRGETPENSGPTLIDVQKNCIPRETCHSLLERPSDQSAATSKASS